MVTTITTYPLARAEQALTDLRAGAFEGTAVLLPERRGLEPSRMF